MIPVPRPIKLAALLLGLAVSLSAVAVVVAAVVMPLMAQGRPAWLLVGFEAAVLAAGVLAVLFGRGRFGDGPGLALAVIAGTVVVGSAFGYLSAGRQIGTTSLTPLLAFRFLCGGLIGAAAAWCVLSRNPSSWRVAALGVALGSPAMALGVAVVYGPARRAVLGFVSGGGLPQVAVAVLTVIVAGGMFCASVHLVIRAFEMGRIAAKRT